MILNGRSWDDVMDYPNKIQAVTKDEIVRVANKYFKDDYLVYRSKFGFPKKDKVDKPPYEAVKPKNAEQTSAYAKKLVSIPSDEIKIDYVDFQKDVHHEELFNNFHF